MKKENLVLVHSFPTNSIILSGLIHFLNRYFKVYFIDLPGFVSCEKALQKISFENYSDFVAEKIEEFKLDNFFIGGMSFSFRVINNLKLDNRCKGIIALEPYTDSSCLRMPSLRKNFYLSSFKVLSGLKLADYFYKSGLFRKILEKDHGKPKQTIDIILNEIDGRTFFETATMVLSEKRKIKFHDLPYVLIMNPKDKTVNYKYTVKIFKQGVKKLLIVNTVMPHYPQSLTSDYFDQNFSPQKLNQILKFLRSS